MNYINELSTYSTSIISDSLDILWFSSWLIWIWAQTNNNKICWLAYTVKYELLWNNKSVEAWNYIDNVNNNNIIIIDNWWLKHCTVWWDILTHMAIIKKCNWTIINWYCRDIKDINKLNYPVFSKGIFMQTWKWRVKIVKTKWELNIEWIKINYWDYVLWDQNWVVVFSKNIIEKVLKQANYIKKIEENIKLAIKDWLSLQNARIKYNYNFHLWNKIKN
jgi:regulator of RNase E activity RraA